LIDKLIEHFSELEDPRCPGKVEHRLIDILVIVVCAVIAGAEELGGYCPLWPQQARLVAAVPRLVQRHPFA